MSRLEKRFTHAVVLMVILMAAVVGQGMVKLRSSKLGILCAGECSSATCHSGCICKVISPRLPPICAQP